MNVLDYNAAPIAAIMKGLVVNERVAPFDLVLAKRLASTPPRQWTLNDIRAGYRLSLKCRDLQIGVEVDGIPAPPDYERTNPEPEARGIVSYDGNNFIIAFPFESGTVDAVRRIPGARFNRDGAPCWVIPRDQRALGAIRYTVDLHRFSVTTDVARALASCFPIAPSREQRVIDVVSTEDRAFVITFRFRIEIVAAAKEISLWSPKRKVWLARVASVADCKRLMDFARIHRFAWTPGAQDRMTALLKDMEENEAASKALDADFEVPEFNGTLDPYQKAAVAYAVKHMRVLNGDKMGLGKTIEGIAFLLAADAFPAVWVSPAGLKINMAREWKRFAPSRTVQIVDGMTPTLLHADVVIINYDILEPHLPALRARNNQGLIVDEAHRITNPKAQRSEWVFDLSRDIPWRMLMSGTFVKKGPKDLIQPLDTIDMIKAFGGRTQFRRRYCMGGELNELNRALRATCYISRRKEEVLKEIPPKRRAPIVVPIDNRAEYQKAERNFLQFIKDRVGEDAEFLASIAHLGEAERETAKRARANSSVQKAIRAKTMVQMEVLKQIAARGKMKALIDWIKDVLEGDEKVIVFGLHTEPLEQLARTFKAPLITGDVPVDERQKAVDRFQTDPTCGVIFCNMHAGGEGQTMTAASNVAFFELWWLPGDHDQAEDRAHRRGQRDSVTAWYFLGENTIDELIAAGLDETRKVCETAMDGGEEALKESVFAEVLAAMAKRAA